MSLPPNIAVLPDVDGMVSIHESLLVPGPLDVRGPVTPYPGWPQLIAGSSNRGGIYCNLDADPELEVVYCSGTWVHAWNMDASSVPGWPQNVFYYPDGAPAYGDIDGDGVAEVVVSARSSGTGNSGRLYAFAADGTVKSGFPVILGGGATKTPVLADLDGDGALETIIEERAYPNGYVGIYSGDGTAFPGWPQQLDYIPGSAAAVGDITGDGIPEIIAESYYSVYAFDVTGQVMSGFPFTPGNNQTFSYSSPVLADLDGDGLREILCGDHTLSTGQGHIHVLRNDGTALPGWPRPTSYWIYGPPAVGDIDGDGQPDVAVGDQVLSMTPVNRVYAWNASGNYLPGFPIQSLDAINCQILLVDLDGDDQVELMFDDNTSNNYYRGYNHDGTPMAGWPLMIQGASFFNNPFAVDMNQDGELDLSGAGWTQSSGTYFYLWDANTPVNPARSHLSILQYNVRHDGVYVPPGTTGIEPSRIAPGWRLGPAAPNPFSRGTAFTFSLANDAAIELIIHDVVGRRIRTLQTDQYTSAGSHTAVWDGRDERGRQAAAGTYWWTLSNGEQKMTRSVVLVK